MYKEKYFASAHPFYLQSGSIPCLPRFSIFFKSRFNNKLSSKSISLSFRCPQVRIIFSPSDLFFFSEFLKFKPSFFDHLLTKYSNFRSIQEQVVWSSYPSNVQFSTSFCFLNYWLLARFRRSETGPRGIDEPK